MDDNQFDDILKGKLDSFEGVPFDPASLAALHHTMAATLVVPFHVRYGKEIFYSSLMVVLSVCLFTAQWYLFHERQSSLEHGSARLELSYQQLQKQHLTLFDSLKHMVEKSIDYDDSELEMLNCKIEALEMQIRNLVSSGKENQRLLSKMDKSYQASLSRDFVGRMSVAPQYISGINLEETAVDYMFPIIGDSFNHESPNNKSGGMESEKAKRTSAELIELDKHYHKGIGVRLGPAVEATGINYQNGSGQSFLSSGILADLIISPMLSIESGFMYRSNYFEIRDSKSIDNMSFPDRPQTSEPFEKIEVDARMVAIPLFLKYRYPVTDKTKITAGVGYTHLIYFNQEFEYTLAQSTSSEFSQRTDRKISSVAVYPGGIHLYGGISHLLKSGNVLEFGPYYELGLGNKGLESNQYDNFGVRGVFWFPVKE